MPLQLLHYPTELFHQYFTESWNKITPNATATANHRRNNFVDIFQWVNFFFWRENFVYKTISFFFTDKNKITDGQFPSVNQLVKLSSIEC